MAPVRSVAALASLACCWGGLAGSSAGGDRSVKQVVDTLRNLKASLEEATRKAEALDAEVSSQCDTALRRLGGRKGDEFSGPRVASLQVALEEQEAAVEESEGTAQQVRANIALVEHTLQKLHELGSANGTLDASLLALPSTKGGDAKLVSSMLSNKQMTLMSLQGELEVLVPAIAQLHGRKTETSRRLEARTRSAASSGSFLTAIRESCTRSSSRASAQSAPRANEQNLIDAAEAALQQLVAAAPAAAQATTEEVSFVQLKVAKVHRHDDDSSDDADESSDDAGSDDAPAAKEATQDASQEDDSNDDGLDDIFSSAVSTPADAAPAPDAAPADDQEAPAAAAQDDAPAEPAATAPQPADEAQAEGALIAKKGKIDAMVQKLLAEVKTSSESDDREWCLEERARTKLAMRLAKDTTTELANEVAAHAEMEAQLAEDLSKLKNASEAVEATSKDVSGGLAKQKSYAASRSKELALATRILSQAVHILSDLQSTSASQGADAHADAQRLLGAAVDSLRQANTFFQDEAKVQEQALEELASSAKAVADSASHCSSDLAAEGWELDFAKSSHASARARAEETKRRYDEDLQEVSKYATGLESTCGQDVLKASTQEETVEARALEDAENVLQGKAIAANSQASAGSSGLRGAASAKDAAAKLQNLSPLERAAQEMGVEIS